MTKFKQLLRERGDLKVKQVLGVGESGLLCRGCLMEAYKIICASETKVTGNEEKGTEEDNEHDG